MGRKSAIPQSDPNRWGQSSGNLTMGRDKKDGQGGGLADLSMAAALSAENTKQTRHESGCSFHLYVNSASHGGASSIKVPRDNSPVNRGTCAQKGSRTIRFGSWAVAGWSPVDIHLHRLRCPCRMMAADTRFEAINVERRMVAQDFEADCAAIRRGDDQGHGETCGK